MEENEIMEKWKKEMKWWGKEEMGGGVAKGYVVLKKKDVEKMRPIMSYSNHLWKVALNTTAKMICFLMK